jgi:hypothetical protein
LATEGLELCLHESATFRKTFCQLLPKMYIPFKDAELHSVASSVKDEYEKTEILIARLLERFLETLQQLPSNIDIVTEGLSFLQIQQ